MPWLQSLLTVTVTAIGLSILSLLVGLFRTRTHTRLWITIETIGLPPQAGIISWASALLRSLTSMKANMREGYERFSKAGRSFAIPSMWVGGTVVVLPPSMLHLLNRPKDELSSFGALNEIFQFKYLLRDPAIYNNTIHFEIVRKNMAPKVVDDISRVIAEEWTDAFNTCWGASKQGRDINVWDTTTHIIARVAQRIVVGKPACRDERYLELIRSYAHSSMTDSCMINCLPPVLRPVLGRLIALRVRYYERRLLKILEPMVEERLRQCKENKGQDNDVIWWLIQVAQKHGTEEVNARRITMRVFALSIMLVFSIGWVFCHAVLEVYNSPSRDAILRELESELRRVSAEHQGLSSKEAIDSLDSLDSTVRESMRLNDVMVHNLPFDNMSVDSLDLGGGYKLPAESRVRTVFPVREIHLDPLIYHNAGQFDPFRFSRENPNTHQYTDKKELTTNISTTFLAFGYGRHSCPGRWFAALIVKQALAHVVANYDVEVIKRPEKTTSLLHLVVPPQAAALHVTRKAHNIFDGYS